MNILFVCTGNTCRSPMAEHLLEHRVAHVDVQSAGIDAIDNQHANEYAEQVMEEKGIQMNHRSQSVTEDLLRWADLVLTMTAQHKHSLMIDFPQVPNLLVLCFVVDNVKSLRCDYGKYLYSPQIN